MMENMNQQDEMEMSAEELVAQKERMLSFYTESMPYIEAQLSYEQVLLQIDEARFKRASIQMQYAMMMQPPAEEEEDDNDEATPESASAEPKERKLKKQ
jgi:hypothetical protein